MPMRPVAVTVAQDMDNGVHVSGRTMDRETMTGKEDDSPPPPAPRVVLHNPYKRKPSDQEGMGCQSQRRNNQTKRAKSLAQHQTKSTKKKKEARRLNQLTLEKKKAFEEDRDCRICSAKRLGIKPPKRSHHEFCTKNSKTKGIPDHLVEALREEERLKKEATREVTFKPIIMSQEEFNLFFQLNNKTVCEASNEATTITSADIELSSKRGGRKNCVARTTSLINNKVVSSVGSADYVFMRSVLDKYKEVAPDTSISCPKMVYALAKTIAENCLEKKRNLSSLKAYMRNMEFCVPEVRDNNNALWDSIVGQKLYIVDWGLFLPEEFQALGIKCPKCKDCTLKRDRTNLSKTKSLFPIFNLGGAPHYALVTNYYCPECKVTHAGNDGALINMLPSHFQKWYPVEAKWARGAQHLDLTATTVFEELLITHGNGDLCSRWLYSAINRDYRKRLTSYLSFCDSTHQKAQDYPKKDGEWLTRFPPLGETIRKAYLEASMSTWNPWRTSDKERHTREIQAVQCQICFAQDHTHQVVKNYPKRLQAEALWDICNEHGEVALAILVRSTETKHFAHALIQLTKRPNFKPSIMYSDTWPHKQSFWEELLRDKNGRKLKGRLGLFHFIQRIVKTLRKNHIDFGHAIRDLLDALYDYDDRDFNKLVTALKDGTMSSTGEKLSDKEIVEMRQTKQFRTRYGKHLRKRIRRKETIITKLEEWKCKYKVTASEGSGAARVDPRTQQTLFTMDTHLAIENCKKKAEYLSDPLPVSEMYREIKPGPNSKHGLSEWISYRGESKLESWHDNLAHFANGGMHEDLSDVINLCGTARYNKQIRLKIRLASASMEERNTKMPAAWESVVSHFNHQELAFINKLAVRCGASKPFDWVEDLPPDNGERFFSEYLPIQKQIQQTWPVAFLSNDHCPCNECNEPTEDATNNETMLECDDDDDEISNREDSDSGSDQDMEDDKEPEEEEEEKEEDSEMQECEASAQEQEPIQVTRPVKQNQINATSTTTTRVTTNQQQPTMREQPSLPPPPPPPQQQQPPLAPSSMPNIYQVQQQLLQQAAFLSTIMCPAVGNLHQPHQPPVAPAQMQPIQNCCIRNIQYWNRENRRGIPPHDKSCRNHQSNRPPF